jgi:hypothetical protein
MDTPAGMSDVIILVVFGLVVAICVALSWRRWNGSQELERRRAQDRAEALLKDMLTAEEYAQLSEYGYLEVRSRSQPTRTYRVPRGPARVAIHERGVAVEVLCVAPVHWLPPSDVVLAHKLMIEGDEQEYLRRATRYHLRVPNRITAPGLWCS